MPTTPTITRELAAFVHDAPVGCATPAAVEVVKQAVLDLAGVTIAGAREEAGRIALAYASSQAAAGPATVLGTGTRLTPAAAALVNGTAGHALDFDDIGLGAGHISVAVLPAVLAVAEQVEADGRAFTDALVLGYEIAHRLTRMYPDTRQGPYAAGYHKPSVYSIFGATAGAARLLGLDVDGIARAFGIAASQSGGLRANFGTMTKPFHAGLSCRGGIEAALLARDGFTASAEILEQRFGWHDVICRGEGDLPVVLDGLGDRLAIEEGLVFKQYPCCGANHYAIDGLIGLMREAGLKDADVDSVDVTIEATNLNDVLVYPWARSPLEGKFCLAYNVAAALVDGAVTVSTFSEDAVARLAAARDRVRVHASTELPANGAHIRLRTTDGQLLERTQLTLRGSLVDPMTWAELTAKFLANVGDSLGPGGAQHALGTISALDELTDLRVVGEALLGVARG
jgi:2-methylcitrate dehydratase PrpD